MDRDSFSSRCLVSIVMLLQTVPGDSGAKPSDESKTLHPESDGTATHILDYAPAPGWTVHVTKEGRLYYCKWVVFEQFFFALPDQLFGKDLRNKLVWGMIIKARGRLRPITSWISSLAMLGETQFALKRSYPATEIALSFLHIPRETDKGRRRVKGQRWGKDRICFSGRDQGIGKVCGIWRLI